MDDEEIWFIVSLTFVIHFYKASLVRCSSIELGMDSVNQG